MSLAAFLEKINRGEAVSFTETMTVIAENYSYQATEFCNGLNEQVLINAAGSNEGSCKLFAFAKLHGLNEQQTLRLFGDYYTEVLNDPNGTGHSNIRLFIRFGWAGINFKDAPLQALAML